MYPLPQTCDITITALQEGEMTKNHPSLSYISLACGSGNITYLGVIFCHLTLLEGSNCIISTKNEVRLVTASLFYMLNLLQCVIFLLSKHFQYQYLRPCIFIPIYFNMVFDYNKHVKFTDLVSVLFLKEFPMESSGSANTLYLIVF